MKRLLVLFVAFAGACSSDSDPPRSLTVVSWGGSYARAVDRAVYQPFEAQTGVALGREDYNGGLAEVRIQVDTGNVHWDVVDLEAFDAMRGCEEGLLERLPADLFADPADFPPGALTECAAGTVFYSTVYAYHPDRFPGEKPATVDDFFDLERFPGRRGMRRSPLVNLEFALMADGVPPEDVYAVLDTPEGMDRAFAKLDAIRDQVVWWEAGAQPPQLLADAEVVMSTAYNGRIFNAQAVEGQPFVIVWDGQVLDIGQVGIVAGTPNLETALDFVRFMGRPESLAAISGYIAYSPVRDSALPLVGTHQDLGIEMLPHMPTNPENLTRTAHSDVGWWADHLDEVNERFSAWLNR